MSTQKDESESHIWCTTCAATHEPGGHSHMSYKQIGVVEVLRQRGYQLDPTARVGLVHWIVVEPGEYPIYSDGLSTFFLWTGKLDTGNMRMGDGLFVASRGLVPWDGPDLVVPSKMHGIDEWQELLDHPVAQEGSPEQRIRIKIGEDV